MPSLLCLPQSHRTNTTAPKPLLMLCTWLLLCSCYIHKLLVILGFFITHVSRRNFLLADAAAACRAELLHLEWHFGGWALQVNKPSKVKLHLCYFGVAGLPLSSCMSDLALGFCIFANRLYWLSMPSQQTNTQYSDANYFKTGHGKLIAFARHVPDNIQLLTLFVGFRVLAILTLRL